MIVFIRRLPKKLNGGQDNKITQEHHFVACPIAGLISNSSQFFVPNFTELTILLKLSCFTVKTNSLLLIFNQNSTTHEKIKPATYFSGICCFHCFL